MKKTFDAVACMRKRRMEIDDREVGVDGEESLSEQEMRNRTHPLK